MSDQDAASMLDSLMESFGNLATGSGAEVVVVDSTKFDTAQLIEDRICGLLLQDSLTTEQVALLDALLQTVR